ncbi:MAG: insulinase family protein [Akkermansiaceae bacterium]|nr:insulinase family protein [Akkermansiaceae bacterium]
MQKATPLILVLILGFSAVILSVRSPKSALKTSPPSAEESQKGPSPERPTAAQAAAPAPITPQPWPHETSDIPADPSATFGALENGLRYIVYPNAEPPKRVSLRLHIASGSLMEADNQRGLAHFLEHMVFNGSKDYASEDLVPKMQRLGIAFGAHVNAYTSFDETVYMLDLPDLSEETLKLGFTVMRDFADGALLSTEEIDKERGVILSEKISRDSVSNRLMEQQFATLLPDSLISKRFPIGLEKVIQSAPRERFTDLYNHYYTPSRMTFVVVGDIEPKDVQSRIQSAFASMVNPPAPGKNPDLGPIKPLEGIETAIFADKEVSSTDVSLVVVKPYTQKPDTAANRADDLTLQIAHSIMSRRFERLSKIAGSAVASGTASNSVVFNHCEIGSIDITATDDRWQEVVPILEQQFRAAVTYGFSEAELAEAKANLLNAYEQEVKQKASRKSENIATALAKSINDQAVFSDPATDLALAQKALDGIDPEACHQAFLKLWDASGHHLILTTKEPSGNAKQDLAALFEDSRDKPVEAPAQRATQPFGYTAFGVAGTIASTKEVKDLGITQLVLSNQVRINLKQTDFEKGVIRLVARIGSGKLTQPKGMPMLDTFATSIFEGGGLGKHSNDELQQILAGKNVGSTLVIGDDAFTLAGKTTPADFTLQAQLMCANLIDPGYREEALWQFQKAVPMIYQQLKYTPAGPHQEMEAWLNGGDSRFTIAPIKTLNSYTINDVKNWLTPELTKGYLELSIVGDFDSEKILTDLLATFGAFATRAQNNPERHDARKIQLPDAPAEKTFTYESKVPQGIATTIWKTAGIRGNQKEFRRLNLLGEIYGDRLREEIREKLGASYSPNAGASGSDAYDNVGYIIGQSVGKPEDLEKLLTTMRKLADNLAHQGATADELDRALKPTLSQLTKSLRDNSYWITTVMSQAQEDPARLDLARTRDADYHSITLDEINKLAAKYLSARNALLISIKPSNP